VAEEPEDRLRRGLAQLQATEFLYETRLFPEIEYSFKHALTHEVAYGSLLAERRRALHARIVGAIEALYPDRLAEHVERLAHHALRGELREKAANEVGLLLIAVRTAPVDQAQPRSWQAWATRATAIMWAASRRPSAASRARSRTAR